VQTLGVGLGSPTSNKMIRPNRPRGFVPLSETQVRADEVNLQTTERAVARRCATFISGDSFTQAGTKTYNEG
jgi:hypothetical protein